MTRPKHGSTFNHKVFRVRGMNLDDLTNPQWVMDEYGYEKAPPELDRLPFHPLSAVHRIPHRPTFAKQLAPR